jgi:hypothetical protein
MGSVSVGIPELPARMLGPSGLDSLIIMPAVCALLELRDGLTISWT